MKFFFTEQLGPKRKLTPEGFLICEDVPIARVGTQLYGEGEGIPVPSSNGVIQIERREEDVFRPETVASGQGKPLVDEHPMVMGEAALDEGWDVNPTNWRNFARGVVINPRRGEGAQRDYLLADFLVTDASTIGAVLDGKVEVSCGYNADYETLTEGRGRQHNILLNHVALVQHGRCGPRCSIGDEDMLVRTRDEARRKTNPTLDKAFAALDKIRRGFKAKDEKLMSEGMEEVEEGLAAGDEAGTGNAAEKVGEHHVHVHLPGAGGSGPEDVTDADPAADPAAGSDLGARLQRLEALFAKFAPALQKLAGTAAPAEGAAVAEEGAAKPSAADDDIFAGPVNMDDPVPAATGDEGESTPVELFGGDVSMDDPAPAATGDEGMPEALKKNLKTGDQAVGYAVKDKDGKLVLRPFSQSQTKDGVTVRARDSQHLAERFTDVLAKAEVLAPGIKVPTFDSKTPATKTVDAMCHLRRRALGQAWTRDSEIIKPFFDGDFKAALPKMPCDTVAVMFNGAAEMVRKSNNVKAGGPGRTTDAAGPDAPKAVKSTGDINERNRKFYNQPARG